MVEVVQEGTEEAFLAGVAVGVMVEEVVVALKEAAAVVVAHWEVV